MPVTPLTRFATALVAVLLLAGTARAQAVYWDKASLLKDFFANSERVTFKKLTPTAEQRAAIEGRLGAKAPTALTVYYGQTGTHVDGFAIIDQEMGQHEPITFGVLIDPSGAMQRLEVLVYREAYGDAVREDRFRRQFKGKRSTDSVRHGADIVAVSGATISSKAMANGARRALILVDELVVKPGPKVLASAAHP